MKHAVLGFWLLFQEPALDEALKAEKARLAARGPLDASIYTRPASTAPVSTTFKLLVRPLSFTDAAIERKDLEAEVGTLIAWYQKDSRGALEIKAEFLPAMKLEVDRAALLASTAGSDEERRALVDAFGTEKADGRLFIVPGAFGDRGKSLWPHKSPSDRGNYLLIPEKGDHRWPGILAHEFGHLLGLEDKYEDKDAKVGRWCLMGTGYLGATAEDPKPAPLCAVCHAGLGWRAPHEVDPTVVTHLGIAAGDIARIPVNRDGKEALVLETRGNSLVAWHTGGGKPIQLAGVVNPETGDRLTPWSDPPFRPSTVGSREVWLTDIRLRDGVIYMTISPTSALTPLEELRRSRVGKPLGK